MEQKQNKRVLSLLHKGTAEYVKSPFPLVNILGPLNLVQQKIIANIIAHTQIRINDYLANIDNRKKNDEYSLFSDADYEDEENPVIKFKMKMSDVCKLASEYKELKEAATRLSLIMVNSIYKEKDGTWTEAPAQLMQVRTPMKSIYGNRGEGERFSGDMIVVINKSVAKAYFHMKSGYAEHIKEIVNICKCSKTPVLYEYLTRYFTYETSRTVTYTELRKILGADYTTNVEKVDEDGNKILINGKPVYDRVDISKYPRFVDFKRRILQPAIDELRQLWDEGKIDFFVRCSALEEKGKHVDLSKITFTVDTTRSKPIAAVTVVDGDYTSYWQRYGMALVPIIGEETAELWMPAVKLAKVTDDEVVICAPVKSTLEEWYLNVYEKDVDHAAWRSVFGNAKIKAEKRDI